MTGVIIAIIISSATLGYMIGFIVCEKGYIEDVKRYDKNLSEYRALVNKFFETYGRL